MSPSTDFLVRRPPSLVRRHATARLLSALLLAATVLLLPTPASAATHATGPSAVWPLTPRPAVMRGFEPPPKPWLPGHRGVDLLGRPGQQVRAAAAGTVTYAGPLAGRGVVVVSHGATRTTYEPVHATVRTGATVTAGQAIGTLSAAGSHCPPQACLHWGLLRDTTYLDPLTMLRAAPIRLLPLTTPPQPALQPIAQPVVRAALQPARQPAVGAAARPPGAEPHALPVHTRADTLHDRPMADRSPPPGSSPAGRAVVALAALLTIATGLLIRRH